jgi:hypothetical protein
MVLLPPGGRWTRPPGLREASLPLKYLGPENPWGLLRLEWLLGKTDLPRLSTQQIAELKNRLGQWQRPDTMSQLVDDTLDHLGSRDFFGQGGLAFLRDAWIAAEFGGVRQVQKVRLVADTFPDFELGVEQQVEAFEAVEADDPNRRRGDEYAAGTGEVEDDPVEDWVARAEQAPTWLAAACETKIGKLYGARANLVIYLNLGEYGIRQKEVERCFPTATERAKGHFDAVWVLWKKRAYLIWRAGKAPAG